MHNRLITTSKTDPNAAVDETYVLIEWGKISCSCQKHLHVIFIFK